MSPEHKHLNKAVWISSTSLAIGTILGLAERLAGDPLLHNPPPDPIKVGCVVTELFISLWVAEASWSNLNEVDNP